MTTKEEKVYGGARGGGKSMVEINKESIKAMRQMAINIYKRLPTYIFFGLDFNPKDINSIIVFSYYIGKTDQVADEMEFLKDLLRELPTRKK